MSLPPDSSLPDYEHGDAHPPLIAGIGGVLFALILVGAAVGALLLSHSPKTGGLPTLEETATDAASIRRDWQAEDSLVRDRLERYAWVDRPHGVVRIPIERAMELEAAKEARP